MKIYKIHDKVIKLTRKAMKNCKVKLIAGEKYLVEVEIKCSTFQGIELPINYLQ